MSTMTIYVDIQSGTYFSNAPVTIGTENWTDEDYNAWEEEMTGNDRCEYGFVYATSTIEPCSPSEWVKEWGRATMQEGKKETEQ
jgi:hypothetical protein